MTESPSVSPPPKMDAANILPELYGELRRLAKSRMANERPQTIGPTALVHEAYLRLLKPEDETQFEWQNHRHFFGAAAEAMRRIMVDRARARNAIKRGRDYEIAPVELAEIVSPVPDDEIIGISEALEKFALQEPEIAEAVKMKYFVGLNWEEIAEVTGLSTRSLRRQWAFARSWLHAEIRKGEN